MTDVPPGRTPHVTRYTPGGEWWDQMVEASYGQWVRFEDYEKVAAELDRLRVVAPQQEQAFTENEIKDVLTSLYQDGHVDLVLADRVAALMQGRAAAVDPPPDTLASRSPETDIDRIIQQVAELPDRTSPEDWPEAMLVTVDELRAILLASDAFGTEGQLDPRGDQRDG